MPRHDSNTAPEAAVVAAAPICSAVGVSGAETEPFRDRAGKCVCDYPASLPPEHGVNSAVAIMDPDFGYTPDS